MSIPIETIPTVFRDGYKKARAMDSALADLYIEYMMIGDPAADAAVDALDGFSPQQKHQMIQAVVDQEENIPSETPQALRDMYEEIMSPPVQWYDPELASEGARAFYRDPDVYFLSLVVAGLIENFATLIGQSFLMTGYTTRQSVERMRQSLRQVVESILPGGLEWYGDGFKLTIRARLRHAQARRSLLKSGQWDVATYGTPISASHVAYATAAFSALVLEGVGKLGVKPTKREREGYMHIWRYIGWLVGVPEVLLLNTEAEGLALLRVGRECEPVPNADSIIMAHTLINTGALAFGADKDDMKQRRSIAKIGYRISRAMIGDKMADQLDFPKTSTAGVLALFRLKRRYDRMLWRKSKARFEIFSALLDATEVKSAKMDYTLPENLDN